MEFKRGLKDGVPIALGYFAVSFSVGILAIQSGISIFQACLMSLTNVTSAGQFAGIQVIAAAGTLLEIAMTQFIINLRYALMSLSLSQKLGEDVKLWQRFVIAFANTDEIFAVAMSNQKSLTFPYMLGLQILPVAGWVGGTFLGSFAYQLLPPSLGIAMNVMLYAMFIAIVIPDARRKKSILLVSIAAIGISSMFYYLPMLKQISSGISIIICTIIAASLGAVIFPVEEEKEA